ncbi:MAG: hypothetical protein R2713_07915 [Ilumatobacteraceae bacterium]
MSTPVSSAPVSSADVEAAADTTTTAAVERTTTTVPPTPVPLGVRWTETTTLAHGVKGIQGERLVQLGDELWAMVDLLDATLTFVSRDGGATFADVQIAPPQQGSTHVTGILRRPDGGYLAYGSLGTNCYSQDQLTEGYLGFQICLRSTGMTWVSDDGAAWEQIEPSGLAGPGDSVFRLIGMVSTPSGYVAAATIASLDWHSRLYTSPDGRAWTLAREMRGEGTGPMSIESLLSDGANVMVLGAEHTCAEPQSANNGYQPDVDFVFRPRVRRHERRRSDARPRCGRTVRPAGRSERERLCRSRLVRPRTAAARRARSPTCRGQDRVGGRPRSGYWRPALRRRAGLRWPAAGGVPRRRSVAGDLDRPGADPRP